MKEQAKPIFLYANDESVQDGKVIIITRPHRLFVLNSKTLELIKTELPEHQFLHIKKYSAIDQKDEESTH